ncbi:MAG: RNA polymerase sigma-54 factor [Planctomycetota bacterium]|nr:MAG: RNA polymerase sigma-54 factor [Planctomycetota bacterium]
MRLEASLQQRLEQRLKLAPQIIQSIEILQLPAIELQDLIKQEMLENPALEIEEAPAELDGASAAAEGQAEAEDNGAEAGAAAGPSGEADAPEPDAEVATAEELETEFARLAEVQSAWSEGSGGGGWRGGPDGEDRKLEAMNNTAARSATLHEYLFEQFALLELTEREREIGEHLIYNIDDATGWLGRTDERGEFVPHALADLVASMDNPCTVEEAERVLRRIQTLDPPGVGARGLQECLLIQIGEGEAFALARRIVLRHLDDLKMNRLPKIAKDTGRTLEEVKEAVEFISSLHPYPGALLGDKSPRHIVPDLECELVDGRYEVRLLDGYVPRVRISPHYRAMLAQQGDNPAVREYLKKKIESAKWLIESIEQRQATLLKIAREIVEYQSDFLDRGIDALKPLKMQHIADKVGVHVSTVSRAIADKYIQTPRGALPLRFFFTGGTTNAEGEAESVLALKQKVKDIVEQEDRRQPLSDEDIARKLKEMGYDIARRTVTKYRKQLGIPSSRQRREY